MTAQSGWVSLVSRQALPTTARELPQVRSMTAPRRAGRMAQPPRAVALAREAQARSEAAHPMTVRVRPEAEAVAKQPAPLLPNSVRVRTAVGLRPGAAAIPRSARVRRAAPPARPRCPDRAWQAMPRVGPSWATTMGAPRQSARSGSARGPPGRGGPRSKLLLLSGLPATQGEPVARTSCAYAAFEPACRGCRRSAPSPRGLCMRIQPTSGGEPPLRRFRLAISDEKQQSRSEKVWHPGTRVKVT
jgi:hypothetical protein